MLEDYLYIKKTKDRWGQGVFTKVDIRKNTPIIEFFGQLHTLQTIPDPENPVYLQITNKWFIGPSGQLDDYINHSCNPNCYINAVGKRATLYSLYDIKQNSELTFDYSLTSTESLESWSMDCRCGYIKCRKIISGYQYLDEDIKKYYQSKDIVPLHIKSPIFKHY